MALIADPIRRRAEVLDSLAAMLPTTAAFVVVDGADGHAAVLADRLAAILQTEGRRCARLTDNTPLSDEDAWQADRAADTVALADGPRWRACPPGRAWDVVIWLRTGKGGDGEQGADIVVDLHDPAWPVIRRVAARLADHGRWYIPESQAFFAAKAKTWDAKFGDDLPAYARAVTEAQLPPGGVVVDAGCGTGRALPALRAAVGDAGVVIGVDLTPQMLDVARARGRAERAALLLADARRLPFAGGSVDAVFAAGLIMHLPDPAAALAELARVTRPGGRLVLFHPSGRAALAARHGRSLRSDEPLAEALLRESTRHAGWRLDRYDDPPHRFLALATRE
jgi:SAM-dependent methyltransferase